jgi:hypothetical protein
MLKTLSAPQLFVPAALYDPTFAAALSGSPVERRVRISVPGKVAHSLKLGASPSPEAVFGYIAMSALLTDLRNQGGNANKLSSVVSGFRALSNQSSPLGTYSIKNGDIEFHNGKAPFVWARVESGQLAVSR